MPFILNFPQGALVQANLSGAAIRQEPHRCASALDELSADGTARSARYSGRWSRPGRHGRG